MMKLSHVAWAACGADAQKLKRRAVDHTPSMSLRAAVTAVAAFVIILLGNGCTPRPAGPTGLSAAPTASVMTARDRARLEAVARERARGAGDSGYVIGPDDLLEI